jgi:hypothetical protein
MEPRNLSALPDHQMESEIFNSQWEVRRRYTDQNSQISKVVQELGRRKSC